ncbi:hypothetical protein MTBUT4_140021 [Magnetospirillum sp. UT-4]|nr:hypothetical protein MTBUT4_140021 [Magnetospirillum sp. UT-4]
MRTAGSPMSPPRYVHPASAEKASTTAVIRENHRDMDIDHAPSGIGIRAGSFAPPAGIFWNPARALPAPEKSQPTGLRKLDTLLQFLYRAWLL